jgi:hypothetical protein
MPDGSGMGMITLGWEASGGALRDPLTRITLTLLDTLDYLNFIAQLCTLPDTLLLFLSKLGVITVDNHELPNENFKSTTYSYTFDEDSGEQHC